jgi:hypothetical protein
MPNNPTRVMEKDDSVLKNSATYGDTWVKHANLVINFAPINRTSNITPISSRLDHVKIRDLRHLPSMLFFLFPMNEQVQQSALILDQIELVRQSLEPFLDTPLDKITELTNIQKAKLMTTLSFALNTFTYLILRLDGNSASKHKVKQELARIKSYYEKILQPRLNKDVSKRLHGLK